MLSGKIKDTFISKGGCTMSFIRSKFERRHFVLRTMEEGDVDDYYYEYPELSEEERNAKIELMKKQLSSMENDISSTIVWVARENGSEKLIGTIYGIKKGQIEHIWVSIPNRSKIAKYGYEVIEQFAKICKENWTDIHLIKLDRSNEAAEKYIRDTNLQSEYIVVA